MSDKILRLDKPFNCPYRCGSQYPDMEYTQWVIQKRPKKVLMLFCGLKKGIVCSNNNVFCDACPLEEID